ncbi:CaiB/BaiF CoA transferase family protein [Paraburkholderia fynbosensis]|uniref:Acetyl-CoA:oxalate CoA-transferase n=1 Tax=Paraburkholderia fynbosensis TaxID=1200993 RepID=A0A6J5H4B5_9BURK|nr:CoA transferase [Paraburkholderia fynbosensis]CAB3810479.1 Acetyl-CoA:oxalate CoA-transferase [Paraburkholderia fynbosensis]
MAGPLAGIKILDLTTVVMGPMATQILGDFGADVIKVEAPNGDSMRNVGPFVHESMGPLYLQANRNKRSIVLNLKDANDRASLLELATKVDVLVFNIRPPAMRRLGLDYATLASVNPGLIVCGAFGFGEDGPYAGRPAYDDILQAASGISSLFQRVNGKPAYAPVNICDRTVGLYLALSVSSALVHRMRTGEGQYIELPMFETMVQFVAGDHIGGEVFRPSQGDTGYKRLLSRQRGPYPTQDGHICVVVYTDEHWRKFSRMIGVPDLVDNDPRFASLQERTQYAEELGAYLAEALPAKTTSEWLALFDAADIPATPVNSIEDLFEDPHLRAVGFWQEVEHPSEGRIRVSQPVGKWSRTQPDVRRLAPKLGEHTDEVFGELLDREAIKVNTGN